MKTPGAFDCNDICFRELARHSARASGTAPCAVVDPAGRLWPSIAAAARAFRLSRAGILYRIERTTTGWRRAGRQVLAEQDQARLIIMLTRASWLARADGRKDEAERLLGWARAVRDGELP